MLTSYQNENDKVGKKCVEEMKISESLPISYSTLSSPTILLTSADKSLQKATTSSWKGVFLIVKSLKSQY